MGISTAAHLPSITSTTYPALTSHLVAAYNGRRIDSWNVTVRVLRSVLPTGGEDGSTAASRAKLMYVVRMNEFPEDTFVLVEDPQCETRAGIKTRHAFAVMQQVAAEAVAAQSGGMIAGLVGDDKEEQANSAEDNAMAVDDPSTLLSSSLKEEIPHAGQTDPVAGPNGTPTALNGDSGVQVSATPASVLTRKPSNKPTRLSLFAASSHFAMLLQRLNLPAPLGAPSSGDGATTNAASAGPGAWLPRGQPITIHGTTYDIPSAVGYGGEGADWRVRLGMIQAGGGGSTRNAGAIVETEYMPVSQMEGDEFLTSYLQNLFPSIITASSATAAAGSLNPAKASGAQATATAASILSNQQALAAPAHVANSVPTPEQWQEVIPASNLAWMQAAGILVAEDGSVTALPSTHTLAMGKTDGQSKLDNLKDPVGWRGKERGRRLAYLYITLLRNQSVI